MRTELLAIAITVAREAADTARSMRAEGVSGVPRSRPTPTWSPPRTVPWSARWSPRWARCGPATRFWARSTAGTERRRRGPLGGGPHRRDGQLPLRSPAVRRLAGRRGRRGGRGRCGPQRGDRGRVDRHPRRRARSAAGGGWAAQPQTDLAQTLVATGFGYDAKRRAHQAEVLTRLITRVRDIRRFGAASLDLCLAAEGGVDAYFEKGLNPWDHAAGGLIARRGGAAGRRPERAAGRPRHARRGAAGDLRPAGRPACRVRRRRRPVGAGGGAAVRPVRAPGRPGAAASARRARPAPQGTG